MTTLTAVTGLSASVQVLHLLSGQFFAVGAPNDALIFALLM
jgi:hypothetical protein